jgi:uncharacterized coiled-coil protein SlyX
MTGYRSKKMSSDIRWLGPYAPADRHADDVTLSHVVELRKKIAEQERQIANLESYLMPIRKEIEELQEDRNWFYTALLEIKRQAHNDIVIETIADVALKGRYNATR